MKRKIKLHTGAYTEIDDTTNKVMTQKEWMERENVDLAKIL